MYRVTLVDKHCSSCSGILFFNVIPVDFSKEATFHDISNCLPLSDQCQYCCFPKTYSFQHLLTGILIFLPVLNYFPMLHISARADWPNQVTFFSNWQGWYCCLFFIKASSFLAAYCRIQTSWVPPVRQRQMRHFNMWWSGTVLIIRLN